MPRTLRNLSSVRPKTRAPPRARGTDRDLEPVEALRLPLLTGYEVRGDVEHRGVEREHMAAAWSRHVSLISSVSSDPWVQ